MRFVMDGEMPITCWQRFDFGKLLMILVLQGATYRAMEFAGSTIQQLTMEELDDLAHGDRSWEMAM